MAGSDGPCEAETDLPRHDATSRSLLDRIVAQHVTILMTSLIFPSFLWILQKFDDVIDIIIILWILDKSAK